jgi:hypothetical protein
MPVARAHDRGDERRLFSVSVYSIRCVLPSSRSVDRTGLQARLESSVAAPSYGTLIAEAQPLTGCGPGRLPIPYIGDTALIARRRTDAVDPRAGSPSAEWRSVPGAIDASFECP